MEFIETSVFTKLIVDLIPDDSYKALQSALMLHPESGALIPGGCGIRKIRWSVDNRGKSGGIRIIYYFQTSEDKIYFLYAYTKSKQSDLTQEQIKMLGQLVREELK
jgi:hypothetical protein